MLGVKRFLAGRGRFQCPGRAAAGYGVQLHYQLPHYRYQRYLARFAAGAQAPVKLPQARPRPPRMLRRLCCRPLSRDQGARPARAVAVLPSICPSSGNSATRVAAVSIPTPGSSAGYSYSRPAISPSSQAMCRCATSCSRRRSKSFSPARNPASPSPGRGIGQRRRRSGTGSGHPVYRFWRAGRRPGPRRAPGWRSPGGRVVRRRPGPRPKGCS